MFWRFKVGERESGAVPSGRLEHTPSTESEESNPSVEVHGRKRGGVEGWRGRTQHWAKP